MNKQPNAQYNLAIPGSFPVRVATSVRHRMFAMFMAEFAPTAADRLLDIGATSDRSYSSSNYFEALYPFPHNITAAGLDDARFLEDLYPGLKFCVADACNLPFEDKSFDYVHASAVWEHVGGYKNQRKMLSECLRAARKGVCLTSPNPWFPVEVHTQLPLIHWLPKPLFRRFLVWINQPDLAQEANLNLIAERDIRKLCEGLDGWTFRIAPVRLLGLKSNLVLFGRANRSDGSM